VRPDPPAVAQDGPDVLLTVHVLPRTSRSEIAFQPPDRIAIRLTAAPVQGAANAACCALLAARLELPKSRVAVLRGETTRRKLIRIRDADAASVLARLQSR
jgi:uncharacterized protein YggU (UPF0235/DUF167 family)